MLLDQHEGRKIASERGLAVAGTIAVLEQTAARELIELPEVLCRFIATNFRIAPEVIEDALERDRVRRAQRRAQESHPDRKFPDVPSFQRRGSARLIGSRRRLELNRGIGES